MTDVKETKELAVLMVKAGKLAIKLLGDGVDFSDGVALVKALADEEFRQVLVDGVAGVHKIPEELKDIDAAEALEIGKLVIEQIQK